MSFFAELRRRNVFRIGTAYAVISWLLVQVIVSIKTPLHLPDWFDTATIVLLVFGFPIALLVAWAFESTPEGIKRTKSTISEANAMEDLELALKSAPEDKSIAVLPFINISSDPEQEYFSDGISEELLNMLSRVPDLKVIARTSSFFYKDKSVPIAQIASELNVAHILEGSVRKAGDRLRITAQLIRASDSSHLWSATYDRTLEDIFAIQDQVAKAVVNELKIKLLGEGPITRPVNPEAYKLYLQGRYMVVQTSFEKAIELFQRAVSIEPKFAQAWAAVGILQAMLRHSRNLSGHAELAQQAAGRALALDPDNAVAHAALGWVALSQGDLAESARYLERALALDPNEIAITSASAVLLGALGRLDEAIEIATYSATKDPVNPGAHMMLSVWFYYSRRWDEAIRAAHTALDLNTNTRYAHCAIGLSLMAKGELELALTEIRQETDTCFRLECSAMIYHALGNTAESDKALLQLVNEFDSQPALIARVYAFRGEADQAFLWLDRAATTGDSLLRNYIHSPLCDGIRDDARWLDPFLKSIGMSPENLGEIEFNFTLPNRSFGLLGPTKHN